MVLCITNFLITRVVYLQQENTSRLLMLQMNLKESLTSQLEILLI